MIVNVENGTSNASIATLLRLATALQRQPGRPGHGLTPGPARRRLDGEPSRAPLWRGAAGGSAVLVASADTPDMLELWDWTLEPGEAYASEPHRAGTRELLHVISGQLTLTVGGDVRRLRAGDAASLVADVVA